MEFDCIIYEKKRGIAFFWSQLDLEFSPHRCF